MRVCPEPPVLYVSARKSGLWAMLADRFGPLMIDADLETLPALDGSVWRGRVVGVTPGVGATLDVGPPLGQVFLRLPRTGGPQPGQTVLAAIQPADEPGKKPRASQDYSLIGRLLVYQPLSRQGLRFPTKGGSINPMWRAGVEQSIGTRPGLWIVRRHALRGARAPEIREEADWLMQEAATVAQEANGPPGMVRPGPDALERVLGHFPGPTHAVTDDTETSSWLKDEEGLPVTLAEDAFASLDLDAHLLLAMSPRVPVDMDSDLWLEETRMAWTFDIDARVAADDVLLDRIFARLLRQIRLRNLSGQMLADPPRLFDEARLQALVKRLRKEAEFDPIGLNVYGASALGLIEMTRQRRGHPLKALLAQDEEFAKLLA